MSSPESGRFWQDRTQTTQNRWTVDSVILQPISSTAGIESFFSAAFHHSCARQEPLPWSYGRPDSGRLFLQELPGHGQSAGVSTLVLVRVVSGLHYRSDQNLRVWTWIPPCLFFFPSVRDPFIGQALQDPPQPVGLSHHLQRGRHYI